MLFTILKIALLLGVIILPLRPQKKKKKAVSKTGSANTVPELSAYVINNNGALTKIQEISLTGQQS